jgi:hypothetical protein
VQRLCVRLPSDDGCRTPRPFTTRIGPGYHRHWHLGQDRRLIRSIGLAVISPSSSSHLNSCCKLRHRRLAVDGFHRVSWSAMNISTVAGQVANSDDAELLAGEGLEQTGGVTVGPDRFLSVVLMCQPANLAVFPGSSSALGTTRTCDRLLRRQLLCPTELRGPLTVFHAGRATPSIDRET